MRNESAQDGAGATCGGIDARTNFAIEQNNTQSVVTDGTHLRANWGSVAGLRPCWTLHSTAAASTGRPTPCDRNAAVSSSRCS